MKNEATTSLTKQTCTSCQTGIAHLKGKEIDQFYQQLADGWKVIEDKYLEKEYNFPNFKTALKFTNDIGQLAEKEQHHPDIHLAWGKVKLILWTHRVHGLTQNDFILAAKCDELFAQDTPNKPF